MKTNRANMIDAIKKADNIPGWMHVHELEFLHKVFLTSIFGWVAEIGSYQGRSTMAIAEALATHGGQLISIDHHGGGPEHQPGGTHFDPKTYDAHIQHVNTWPLFLENIAKYSNVLPFLGTSENALIFIKANSHKVKGWPFFDAVFIDGGHKYDDVKFDIVNWGELTGMIIVHDYEPGPGDRGWIGVYRAVQEQLELGWKITTGCGTLVVLERK